MREEHIMIGEIVRPQGINGEVKLRPITSDPGRFEGMTAALVRAGEGYARIEFEVRRAAPDAVIMKISGVDDRTAAEALRGTFLYVERAQAIELGEDANFICDLIGIRASDDTGRHIGELTEVLQPGGGDVYVFKGPLGEVLVPALKSVVINVDIDGRTMLLSAARLSEVAVFED